MAAFVVPGWHFPPPSLLCVGTGWARRLLGPASSSASLARRQWVDPFRTEVYSGEILGFLQDFICRHGDK